MADNELVVEQILEPNPATAQRPFGEHYPWIYTFTGEDVLEVTSWNSAAGVRLRIAGRVHAGPLDIKPFSAAHVPNTDRTSNTTIITMPAGELLNAIVYAETGSPQAGQTFVRIAVRRGAGGAFERLGIIVQGQVTANTARTFPGSSVQSPLEVEPYLRVIQGTTPAAGAAITETVPTGVRWEIMTFNYQHSTGALPANRTPYMQATSGGLTVFISTHPNTIPGSAVYSFTWAQNIPSQHDTNEGLSRSPIPQRLILPSAAQIVASARNILSSDQLSGVSYNVREWLDI